MQQNNWPCFSIVIIGWLITHLFAVLTHHRADPRWAQLLPTQQTTGHSIPNNSLLHVVQPVDQAPAAAQGEVKCMHVITFSWWFYVNVHIRHCMFCNLSPNSLLLHGLHFLSTGNDIIYNFFLLICKVWTRTRARLHGPLAPAGRAHSPVEITLF